MAEKPCTQKSRMLTYKLSTNWKKTQMNNIKNNDITDGIKVAGTDFFVDSEDLLEELTDSDLSQIVGGGVGQDVLNAVYKVEDGLGVGDASHLSLLVCG